MPRTEARIFTSIWRDPDFLALPGSAQRLYMFFLSQPELTYCGTMPLRMPRWVGKAAGLTLADIERDLKELEGDPYPRGDPAANPGLRQPFVITDEVTGELLVRALIRRDTAWKQPNLLKLAIDAAGEIESARIRCALLTEVRRLPLDESPSAQVKTLVGEFIVFLEKGLPNPSDYPSGDPYPEGTDEGEADPADEGGDEGRARARILRTPISGLQTLMPSPPAPDRKLGHRLPEDFTVTREMVAWARENCPHVDSKRETDRFCDYWLSKAGKDARKTDWPRTWKNWMRTAEDRQGPRGRPVRQQETDEMFAAAARRIAAREGAE